MGKKYAWIFILIIALVISQIIFFIWYTRDGKTEVIVDGVKFEIKDAAYENTNLVLTINTNASVDDVRIDILDEEDDILCTRYKDLTTGDTEVEITDCEIEEKVTVSVNVPSGGIVTRKFSLELPSLELKEGFKYNYEVSHSSTSDKRDVTIYVTKETSTYWEGISSIMFDESDNAFLRRWKIQKSDLDMSATATLREDDVVGDVDYIDDLSEIPNLGDAGNSILPFWMIILKDMNGLNLEELITQRSTTLDINEQHVVLERSSSPEAYGNYLAYTIDIEIYTDNKLDDSGDFIISTEEPYLMLKTNAGGGPQAEFKTVERQEFSLDDFEGYNVIEWATE
jgi:hypothetical protein